MSNSAASADGSRRFPPVAARDSAGVHWAKRVESSVGVKAVPAITAWPVPSALVFQPKNS